VGAGRREVAAAGGDLGEADERLQGARVVGGASCPSRSEGALVARGGVGAAALVDREVADVALST
jgi:hypothetical protein